jgi:hypothetical protein
MAESLVIGAGSLLAYIAGDCNIAGVVNHPVCDC